MMAQAAAEGTQQGDGTGPTEEMMATIGLPDAEITTVVDVAAHVLAKLAAMRCHETQVGDMAFFLGMSDEVFAQAFGREWFVRLRAPEGTRTATPSDRGSSDRGSPDREPGQAARQEVRAPTQAEVRGCGR